LSLPNIITIGRLLAVPVAVGMILNGYFLWAFWVFVAAGVSDAIDGFIAKKFDAETELGRFLDPLVDKVLLVSVYVSLGQAGHLPTWLVIGVVFRDLLIVGGAILFQTLTGSLSMNPIMISKINTAAQIVLAAMVLGLLGFEADDGWFTLIEGTVYLVAATTFLSGAMYVVSWSRRATAMEEGE
jgi:cardiolipin synthase